MAPATASPLTDFQLSLALKLCNLGYETKPAEANYAQFKLHVTNKYLSMIEALKLKSRCLPYIAFVDEKIRVIAINIGNIVFICVCSTDAFSQHLGSLTYESQPIVACNLDAEAPRVYVDDVNELGIVPFLRAILDAPSIEKVIVCGHGRGGCTAHVAHYNIITNPNFYINPSKIMSISFGSTPFLSFKKPNDDHGAQFISCFTDMDIVPGIFTSQLQQYYYAQFQQKQLIINYVYNQDSTSDLVNPLDTPPQVLQEHLEKYSFFGQWIKLSQRTTPGTMEKNVIHIESRQHPKMFFGSNDILKTCEDSPLESVISQHRAYLSMQHNSIEVPEYSDDEYSQMNKFVHEAAARCLLAHELKSRMLPLLLNKAIIAAALTTSFGDNSIYKQLQKFGAANSHYRMTAREAKAKKTTEKEVEGDDGEAKWNDLMTNIKSIKEKAETSVGTMTGWRVFNQSNIATDLNALTICMSNAIAENCLSCDTANSDITNGDTANSDTGNSGWFSTHKKRIGKVALGLFGLYLTGGLGIAAYCGVLEFLALVGTVAKSQLILEGLFVLSWLGGTIIYGALSYSVLSSVFATADAGTSATARHARVELYQDSSSCYTHHLKAMSKAANLKCATNDEELELEDLLCNSPDNIKTSDPQNQALFEGFVKLIREIKQLRQLISSFAFIIINGNQCVGKTWFIKSLNNEVSESRKSTNEPRFYKYTPQRDGKNNATSKLNLYLVDLPGNNSESDILRRYVNQLFGIGSIGINLFVFDTRPQNLQDDLLAMRQIFNGCDNVLVCLNKVMSNSLPMRKRTRDPMLIPILQKWTDYFKQNGIIIREGDQHHTKYSLMATDLTGTSELRPLFPAEPICPVAPVVGDADFEEKNEKYKEDCEAYEDERLDYEEDCAKYDKKCRDYDDKVRENLHILKVNGGKGRKDVVEWIDAAIERIMQSRRS